MLIRALHEHWPARKIEWFMAGFTVNWGLYVLIYPEVFTQQETAAVLSEMVSMVRWTGLEAAVVWGGAALFAGLTRALALFINGAYVRTPLFRALAAFGTMFIFTQVFIALWRTGLPSLQIVIYAWLVFADLLSAYRAAQDGVYAEAQRRNQKDAGRVICPHLVAS